MMAATASPGKLVCAGEFYTDLIFFGLERLPSLGQEVKTDQFAISTGGRAAITATAAALLGCATELITVWGDSALDSEARIGLEASGVDCSSAAVRPDEMSGISVAVSTREDRCFLTYPGTSRAVEQHLLDEQTVSNMGRAGHVHFALAPRSWAAFRQAVRRLRRGGSTVSWDLGWDPAAGGSRGFRDLCRELDVVFLNEDEARRYAGAGSTQEALSYFARPHSTVVIKRGASGAIGSRAAGPPIHVGAIRVEAIETTGAGDAFNGGFLHSWLAGEALQTSLLAGNICGGLSTRAAGGVKALPTRAEFDGHLGRLKGLGTAGSKGK
ncbi:MAG: carbohydrate kinase family protein [Bryobacterales bacterium]|nr:carbohydrate kinase family protein [Bryobacterales bacterium]